MSRPELSGPPELFYNEAEATKYHANSRIIQIQEEISRRAIELLSIPAGESAFVLDVGCGSGLSGEALEEAGHSWLGVDVSPSMLSIAAEKNGLGDVALQDMGQKLPFRPGIFDGCISISAVQWLAYSNHKGHNPLLQLYPETPEQMEMISNSAMRAGFSGGLVIDYPNSAKAKKYYLCLFAGIPNANAKMPAALGTEPIQKVANFQGRSKQKKGKRGNERAAPKSRDWILAKKERQRMQGRQVRPNSKFTARKRPTKF